MKSKITRHLKEKTFELKFRKNTNKNILGLLLILIFKINIATANQKIIMLADSTDNWTGAISGNWFDAANWSSGIPTETVNLRIPSSALNMPLINAYGALCNDIIIDAGAILTLDSAASLLVSGNWSNNGTFVATSGIVNFNGQIPQTLSGATTFCNFGLDNSAGLMISSSITITGTAQLINGIVTTGSSTVTIANGAYLLSTYGYVNGYLAKYVSATDFPSVSFEVGSATAYAPVNINFNQILTSGYLTVNTISTDHPSLATSGFDASKTINRYWNFVGSGLTFDYYSVDLFFDTADADAGFIDAYAGAKIYSGMSWHLASPDYSTPNSMAISGVATFGAFEIGVFNPSPLAFSLTTDYGYRGMTSNIIFNGRGFINGVSSVNPVPGITINSTTVNNDSTLTLNITVSSSATTGVRNFAVTNIINAAAFGGTSDSLTFTVRKRPVASFYANRTSIKCNASGSVEFVNYSQNGVSYHWDFGTGASPSTADGNGPYVVTYSTTGPKTVKLVAYSPIGNDSLTKINYINVTANAPLATSISGPKNIACSSSEVYVAPIVPDVTYNWIVPSGATITSGLGTRAIRVSFSGTFGKGTISLTLTNGCGTSVVRSISVSRMVLTPGLISGPTTTCGLASAVYSIAPVAGAVDYTWTLPAGVTSSSGTSSITTTSTSITVNVSSTFSAGTLSVIANNTCLSSAARKLGISKRPHVPGEITGSASICGSTTATYSIAPVAGATSYTWIASSGITILSGQGTTSINVSILSSISSGTLKVVSNNTCSSSGAKMLTLVGCRNYTQIDSIAPTEFKLVETTLYPNPSSGSFNLQYTSEIRSQLVIKMYNAEGQILINKIETVTEGINNFNYNEDDLKKGIYFIQIIDEKNNVSKTEKLIIQSTF